MGAYGNEKARLFHSQSKRRGISVSLSDRDIVYLIFSCIGSRVGNQMNLAKQSLKNQVCDLLLLLGLVLLNVWGK